MKRLALVLAIWMPGPAIAQSEPCSAFADGMNAAVAEIELTMKRYVRCVNDSAGRDDCYTTFRRLKRAHEDFESKIASYKIECP